MIARSCPISVLFLILGLGSIPDSEYCLVVNISSLRLLSPSILPDLFMYIIDTNIVPSWLIIGETHFTTYQRFVADQSAISPFWAD